MTMLSALDLYRRGQGGGGGSGGPQATAETPITGRQVHLHQREFLKEINSSFEGLSSETMQMREITISCYQFVYIPS